MLDRLAEALADRYRLERELGQGGMATVYLAEDLRHRRPVAIKVLRPELAATIGPERFMQEIEIAARLQHPHILPVHDSGEAGGFLFYVMPYVEGESLRERLLHQGELPIHAAVRLLVEVADALAYAHGRGVVHRDIKPENIMVSGRHALVMDFGVAKAVSEASGRNRLTTAGVALGTPAYMAPEQASADPNLDQRVDIYALGVLGYELLAGRPPFTGATPQQVLAAHVTQAPEPVTTLRPAVSPALATVVMRALEKRPADRWQTADEMLALLEPLATPSGGMTPTETRPIEGVRPARASRRLVLGAAAGAAILALAWLAWRGRGPEAPAWTVTNIRQVSREATLDLFAAISPDGREVAYQSGPLGGQHIVVRDIAGGRPLVLTGDWTGSQERPRWLPEGRELWFRNRVTTPDHAAGAWSIPRLGGQATLLDSADLVRVRSGIQLRVDGDSITWFNAGGLEAGRIPNVSPFARAYRADGGAIAYVVGNVDFHGGQPGNVSPSAVWVAVAGHEPRRLTDTTALNLSPAWLPDGSLLYVSDRGGARDVWAQALERDGRPRGDPLRLTSGLGAISVSASADGRTLAYTRFTLRQNIYALPLPAAGATSIREARPVTTGSQVIENLDISDDGRWLAYDSNREGNQDIYVQPLAGGEPRRVTRDPGDDFAPDLAPGGAEIAFHTARHGGRDIYVIGTDGSGEQRITRGGYPALMPAFSPDGLAIAFGGFGDPVSIGIAHRTTRTAPWRVPDTAHIQGAYAPRWSPDGRRIVHDLRAGNRLGIYTMGDADRVLLRGEDHGFTLVAWPEWSGDGRWIYFKASDAQGMGGLYVVNATGGPPRLVVRGDDPNRPVYPGAPLIHDGTFYMAIGEMEGEVFVMDLVRR